LGASGERNPGERDIAAAAHEDHIGSGAQGGTEQVVRFRASNGWLR
jgi:hypothetical protein